MTIALWFAIASPLVPTPFCWYYRHLCLSKKGSRSRSNNANLSVFVADDLLFWGPRVPDPLTALCQTPKNTAHMLGNLTKSTRVTSPRAICSAEWIQDPKNMLHQKSRTFFYAPFLNGLFSKAFSVTFLAGHGEICPPHGWSTWRPADQPTTRRSTWTWCLFIEKHTGNRRVVGWSAGRHVDRPCGGQISPWPARRVTDSKAFSRGKTAIKALGRGNGPLRRENAPLALMGSFRTHRHGGKRLL